MENRKPALVQEYEKNGFVKAPEPLFSNTEFTRLSDIVTRLANRTFPGKSGFRRHSWLAEPDILEFASHKSVIQFLEPFLGPNFAVYSSSVYKKRANSQEGVPWHSDVSNYEKETGAMNVCSLTIAMNRCDLTSGCIEYAPGSHLVRARKHRYDLNPENSLFGEGEHYELTDDEIKTLAASVPMELESGESSLCDIACVHRSGPNKSNHDRVNLVLRFFSTSQMQQFSELQKNFWRGHRYTFLISGRDELGICRHNLSQKS